MSAFIIVEIKQIQKEDGLIDLIIRQSPSQDKDLTPAEEWWSVSINEAIKNYTAFVNEQLKQAELEKQQENAEQSGSTFTEAGV